MKFKVAVLTISMFYATQAGAISFNDFVSFGDSSIDNGWWSGALQQRSFLQDPMGKWIATGTLAE
jgi:hypothetical protein